MSSPVTVRAGIDLVKVADVRHSIATFGDAYLQRLFTPGEIAACSTSDAAQQPERFAARFAAKEAMLKVLQPNAQWVDWRLIEVVSSSGSAPQLNLTGEAKSLADQAGIFSLSLSFSHEADMATAVVVALCKQGT